MAYYNPIHTPVPTSSHSSFSSLSGGSSSSGQFASSRRRRIPGTVPQSRSGASAPSISFDLLGFNGQGVPMRELAARSISALAQMVTGANDRLGAPGKRIVFRICWPGYSHVDYAVSIDLCPNGVPLCRAQLGAMVVQHFARFVEKGQSVATTDALWRIGAGAISFQSLVLVGLVNVGDDVWVADVAVDA